MAEVRERWEIGGGRGDPDAILQRIREEEEAGEAERFEGRGRLKVFFGYAAGVGKTFAMLTEAHHVQDEGVDVVVGYVEPHTRADTLALLDGLEVLPVKSVKHRNVALREFDLDAALKRRPQVVLVDELAHTNAPGCRHRKRYQDVEELLRAGIDVYTTVNVQHLEGLNDKIASVTAVAPSERIPDRVFDAADSVEVVDLEPADLIKRLRSGKIYAPERIGSALSHFFSRSNLAALREIALRRAADRLTRASAATVPHAAGGEDVLVLVTADAAAPRVIRAAAGMAEAFGGSCTALVVESGGEGVEGRSKGDAALARSIALAEEMGARIVTLTGDDPVQPVALYAAAAGIRRIVVPSMPGRIGLLGCGDVASRLMRAAPEAMVTAVPAVDAPSVLERLRTHASFRLTASDVFRALLAIAVATALGEVAWLASPTPSIILMTYLLVALLLATRADGFLYAVLVALGSVVAYNFFFTAPRYTFHAYSLSAPIIFAFLLIGTLGASSLAIRLKRQATTAARRAYRTEVLLESMVAHGIDKIVFSSTAATYGEPESIPILETDPTVPTNCYGETKLSMEKMFHWTSIAHNLRYVSLRYFNACGAHPNGKIGEAHNPETHLIPLILQVPNHQREYISIFGTDYDTKDGTCVRDYIHVNDLAQAHILAMNYLRNGGKSDIFNLGNGVGFTVKEVVETAREVTGHPIPAKEEARRAGDPSTLIASSGRAKGILGWKPQYADLRVIIETAWKWHQAHPHGYKAD